MKGQVGIGQSEYFYDSVADGTAHAYLLPALCDILQKVPDGSRVLDLGCGNGSMIRALEGLLNKRFRWSGVDSSTSGIALARAQSPEADFWLSDLADDEVWAEREGIYDVIFSTEVIEHVLLPRNMVRKIEHALSKNGVVIISTPYHGYLKNLALAAFGRLDTHFTALWDYGHIKFWSRLTLESLFREQKFDSIQFCGVGRFPLLWKSMIVVFRRADGE